MPVPQRREPPPRIVVEHAARELDDPAAPAQAKVDVALGPELHAAMERVQERHGEVTLPAPLPLEVDRPRARFGAWYELFPRSWGGFRGVAAALPELAALGFDVAYLPPVHPIGLTNRKGRNNALTAGPGDPGSPFAFWEWLIAEVKRRDPEVLFLAEAFTREAKMQVLAKLGFSQSYTYFTWKNARWELMEYVGHLAYSGMQEYFRPNFFANTPDI